MKNETNKLISWAIILLILSLAGYYVVAYTNIIVKDVEVPENFVPCGTDFVCVTGKINGDYVEYNLPKTTQYKIDPITGKTIYLHNAIYIPTNAYPLVIKRDSNLWSSVAYQNRQDYSWVYLVYYNGEWFGDLTHFQPGFVYAIRSESDYTLRIKIEGNVPLSIIGEPEVKSILRDIPPDPSELKNN